MIDTKDVNSPLKFNTTAPLAIGGVIPAVTQRLNGSVDDFRIYTRTLSSYEIQYMYKSLYPIIDTDPDSQNTEHTVLSLKFDNEIKDTSIYSGDNSLKEQGTLYYIPSLSYKALYINTSGHLQIQNNDHFQPNQELTLEFWIKPDTFNQTAKIIDKDEYFLYLYRPPDNQPIKAPFYAVRDPMCSTCSITIDRGTGIIGNNSVKFHQEEFIYNDPYEISASYRPSAIIRIPDNATQLRWRIWSKAENITCSETVDWHKFMLTGRILNSSKDTISCFDLSLVPTYCQNYSYDWTENVSNVKTLTSDAVYVRINSLGLTNSTGTAWVDEIRLEANISNQWVTVWRYGWEDGLLMGVKEEQYSYDNYVFIEYPWYNPNNWTYIVFTAKYGNLSLYINGNLTASYPLLHSTIATSTTDLTIGQNLSGAIDNLKIHNIALTPEQIKQSYQALLAYNQSSGQLTITPPEPNITLLLKHKIPIKNQIKTKRSLSQTNYTITITMPIINKTYPNIILCTNILYPSFFSYPWGTSNHPNITKYWNITPDQKTQWTLTIQDPTHAYLCTNLTLTSQTTDFNISLSYPVKINLTANYTNLIGTVNLTTGATFYTDLQTITSIGTEKIQAITGEYLTLPVWHYHSETKGPCTSWNTTTHQCNQYNWTEYDLIINYVTQTLNATPIIKIGDCPDAFPPGMPYNTTTCWPNETDYAQFAWDIINHTLTSLNLTKIYAVIINDPKNIDYQGYTELYNYTRNKINQSLPENIKLGEHVLLGIESVSRYDSNSVYTLFDYLYNNSLPFEFYAVRQYMQGGTCMYPYLSLIHI